MIIDRILLYSGTTAIASFPIGYGADSTQSYILKSALGLDASEILPQYYSAGSQTKNKFYNMKLAKREVVLRIGLNPQYDGGETPGVLRDKMYAIISAYYTAQVEVRLRNGISDVASISGFITKIEASHFTATPEIQITIRCDYPYFRSPSRVSLNTAGFTTGQRTQLAITDNLSTTPHGFQFKSTCLVASPTGYSINFLGDTDWIFYINYSFLVGDQLFFSSEEDNRYLYVIRSGTTIQIADKLLVNSIWPLMFPGVTTLSIGNGSGFRWDSFTYYNTYWGV